MAKRSMDLRRKQSDSRSATITLRKHKLPPLVIKQLVRTVLRKEVTDGAVKPTQRTRRSKNSRPRR